MGTLTEEMTTLAADILSSADERQEAIGRIRSEAKEALASRTAENRTRADEMRSQLAGFREEHSAMAEELRSQLAEGETARVEAFGEMHERIVVRVAELADATREFMSDCSEQNHRRAQEVRAMLDALRADYDAAHRVWQDFTRSRAGLPASEEIEAQLAENPDVSEPED